jgi:HK97 gp10 family phage protein
MPDRTVINHAAIEALKRSREAQEVLLDAARPLVSRTRAIAPKRTGAGAASIHAEAVFRGGQWEVRVGWDRLHNYLRFVEFGTSRGVEARHFLERGALGAVSLTKRI